MRERFDSILSSLIFAVTLARDVSRCLKEEKKKERLCLTLA